MNALKSFVSNLKLEQSDGVESLWTLLNRATDSSAIEDRRSSLRELSILLAGSSAARSEFASVGFKSLCQVLQRDLDDPTLVRLGLECLVVIVLDGDRERGGDRWRAAIVNSEQFARTEGAIPLVVSLLDSSVANGLEGFRIKELILHVLQGLLWTNSLSVRQAILDAASSISSLVGLLGEHEVLTQLSVMILTVMVESNTNSQNAALASGVLEKAAAIIREEGWMLGGAIVRDCLKLMETVVRENKVGSNRLHSSGFLCYLEQTLIEKEAKLLRTTPNAVFSPERNVNVTSALQLLIQESHKNLPSIKFIDSVVVFASHQGTSADVHAAAWDCLNLNFRHFHESLYLYINDRKLPLAHMAIRSAMICDGSYEQRNGMQFLYQLCESADLQMQLVQELKAEAENDCGILQFLYSASDIKHMYASSNVALLLSSLLIDNLDTKQILLHLKFKREKDGILEFCAKRIGLCITNYGVQSAGQSFAVLYALLLIAWLQTFPPAVDAFLNAIRQKPFLVGVLQTENQFGKASADIQGACALLLGLCCVYAGPTAAVDPSTLLKAIADQVTYPRYFNILSELQKTMKNGTSLIPHYCFQWIEDIVIEVKREIGQTGNYPVNDEKTNVKEETNVSDVPSEGSFHIREAIKEPTSNKLMLDTGGKKSMLSAAVQEPHGATEIRPVHNQEVVVLELKSRCQELEAMLEKSIKAEQSMRSALSKVEADLEGLSREYAALDSHASKLQLQLSELQCCTTAEDGAANGNVTDDVDIEELLVCLGQEEAKANFLKSLCEKHGIQVPEEYR